MSQPDTDDLTRAVEAWLFAAEEPLTREQISAHLGGADVTDAGARAHARETCIRHNRDFASPLQKLEGRSDLIRLFHPRPQWPAARQH